MSQEPKLHIVSFDVPYPPDYGGVIDVFYKLKALSEIGIKIYLHCFVSRREPFSGLEQFCEKVFYYPRKSGLLYALKKEPYIVATRNSPELLKNLRTAKAPILFEGLHTCFSLNHLFSEGTKQIARTHNVEHDYYTGLAKSEANPAKKLYFFAEAAKLRRYEGQLKFADTLLTISPADQAYFEKIHPSAFLIPAFHSHDSVISKTGKGDYALFHGNLSVPENLKAAGFLIGEVFSSLKLPFIIAGKNPPAGLIRQATKFSHIKIIANPGNFEMEKLVQNAQVCLLPTFQQTGLKLKLLDSLFAGRFCIANKNMVENTGLEKLCIIANSAEEIKKALQDCFGEIFTKDERKKRAGILNENFSNRRNAQKLVSLIFG